MIHNKIKLTVILANISLKRINFAPSISKSDSK